MKLTTKQLVAELRKIADKIEQNDSFEGSIFYTCNAERLEPDEWEVSGDYRLVDINYKNWKNQSFDKGGGGVEATGGRAMSECHLAESLFNKCVEVHHVGQRVEIRCRLGLWSVEASNLDVAKREARHYWVQYLQDGEYNALLSEVDRNMRAKPADSLLGVFVTAKLRDEAGGRQGWVISEDPLRILGASGTEYDCDDDSPAIVLNPPKWCNRSRATGEKVSWGKGGDSGEVQAVGERENVCEGIKEPESKLAKAKWNATSDRFNQWDALGQDERDELIQQEQLDYEMAGTTARPRPFGKITKERITRLEAQLAEAVRYLKQGKAQFAPNTTNSDVDNFIKRYEEANNGG